MYRPFLLHRPLSPPLAWLGLSVLIFAACLVGIFARPIGFLSVFWPANALLLGLLVRYPRLARPPAWVAAAVGYVAADLVTGSSWSMALWLNGANLLGATAGWLVLRRLDERIRRLQRTISALYLLLAALAASAVGALAGCGAAPVYFNSPWTDLLSLWFSTELMNYMLIVPVVLAAPRADDPPPATQEVPLIWRVAPVSSLLLAEGVRTVIGGPGMLAFVVPGLLWCALSYSPFVSSLLSLVVCLWTMAGVATGVLNFTPAHASDVFSLRVGVTLLALGPLAVACASAARAEALRRLDHAVRHDDLTGVLARRAFLQQGERLLARYQRESAGLAVLMVDVDHFKQVNDQLGHGAGDQLLIGIAQAMTSALRPQDVLGRLGGEEFAVVLPDASPAEAHAIAERLRTVVEQRPFGTAQAPEQHATVSIGLVHSASLGGDADLDTLLLAADAALYRAKAEGRNRVMTG
ncbi:MAG: diguanylate cyclase [Burkholderiales bacterium RIFCSPHIGHO2_01_FULL_64_960]|jgi:diguanylate cyclase (GGDEF)-like protein|uniref:sensor domain-containing diguanylate cyclase n=1 Tax=Acidovorax sp. 94 TaxID=2135633 RepID=UPI0008B2AD12|nr:GGDEF domain-containing protein [Acidovorax sp. 94]OGA57744.1 MAG: diguanylate cyclase [Burkholderiales bacterium RIFCSPHIGHO2_01_FULL_64_960]RKR68609.1 diguanylate cyclase (GGDEF)-like protein [Acidovorax sp. 94]